MPNCGHQILRKTLELIVRKRVLSFEVSFVFVYLLQISRAFFLKSGIYYCLRFQTRINFINLNYVTKIKLESDNQLE
jgi:hypothetical protein